MRKWLIVAMTAVILLSASACTSPFAPAPETEAPSAERTFVITERTHEGLEKVPDAVQWQDNALCAVQYVGTRGAYAKTLQPVFKKYFSSIDAAELSAMQKIDLTGDEVYLIVPRFELEVISVFSIAIDSTGKTHILKQSAETTAPFLLFCKTGTNPNCAFTITLNGEGTQRKMRVVMRHDEETGQLDLPAGVQLGLEKS